MFSCKVRRDTLSLSVRYIWSDIDLCVCAVCQVRRKTLDLVMDLVTSRTVEELVLVLKKEVTKTHNTVEHEDVGK